MSDLRLTQQVAEAFLPNPPEVVGVAVSGGGDSMALLHLMHGFCTLHGCKLRAVTVDHGLRADAAKEADLVRQYCTQIGVPHEILLWKGWTGQGNLQSAARDARYALVTKWAQSHALNTIAFGHTADDQAETFLMRLARRSGVDGLAGMPLRIMRNGIAIVRPLLAASRADLRAYLESQQIDWVEDPSNQDRQFERVRTRQALVHLAELGIDASVLSEVAGYMAEARKALGWQTFLAARDLVEIDAGAVVFDDRKLRTLPDEIQRRLIVQAVNWISGADFPARRGAIQNLMSALRKGQAGTADGVHVRRVKGRVWIFRELNAVRDVYSSPKNLWDHRWRLLPPDVNNVWEGYTVRALGNEGLNQCPDWRATGRPHEVLLSTPAVWRGNAVVAAPLAGCGQKWHADIDGGNETFFAALLTH